MKAIAVAIATLIAMLLLGSGTANAGCQTQCYNAGNTGYHCVTSCT